MWEIIREYVTPSSLAIFKSQENRRKYMKREYIVRVSLMNNGLKKENLVEKVRI